MTIYNDRPTSLDLWSSRFPMRTLPSPEMIDEDFAREVFPAETLPSHPSPCWKSDRSSGSLANAQYKSGLSGCPLDCSKTSFICWAISIPISATTSRNRQRRSQCLASAIYTPCRRELPATSLVPGRIGVFFHNFAAKANQHLIPLISLDSVSVHTLRKYRYGISTTFPSAI